MSQSLQPRTDADTFYLAAQQLHPGDTEATLEMRETSDGQVAVMVYSSLDTLVAGAGPAQPWIAVPRENVEDLVAKAGADGVLLDTVVPPELRHGTDEPQS